MLKLIFALWIFYHVVYLYLIFEPYFTRVESGKKQNSKKKISNITPPSKKFTMRPNQNRGDIIVYSYLNDCSYTEDYDEDE